MRNILLRSTIYCFSAVSLLSGCRKLLEIPPPIDSITTKEVFANNKQAEWTIAAIYSKLINGDNSTMSTGENITGNHFAAGLTTIMAGLSADELIAPNSQAGNDRNAFTNKLRVEDGNILGKIWESAYRIIFDCNAAMEGIQASTSPLFTDSARKQLMGEALALRAFCYFYLVNFYGDVPLALSSDFTVSQSLRRSPVAQVYAQMKTDLQKAKTLLAGDFSVSKTERVRVNKWFAEALLARIYLYTGEYPQAIQSASAVISQSSLFSMPTNLSNVFAPNNGEAIFQLKPATDNIFMNGTPEGYVLYNIPFPGTNYIANYEISSELANAFESNDQRKNLWIEPVGTALIAAKYKRMEASQYYNVIRLAELHLIRAEATILHTPANKTNAIEDINILRRRAGVDELDEQLTNDEVIAAIAHERQVELFLEWGHRWFDLKRTGKAHDVLSAVSYKQPWEGDYQLLYPIAPTELTLNANLIQNPEYRIR